MIDLLLKHGADPAARNNDGITPLSLLRRGPPGNSPKLAAGEEHRPRLVDHYLTLENEQVGDFRKKAASLGFGN